ncbi:YfbU family protein [Curtobacterium sp. MCPF17_011]|uniref:YfbU family protein n=1 Tax=Curtobacterium sp. MCPF17_011 TaxID=2175652 RepID=UPI000DA913AA|nr:YfbU family protein [Curtobacterium sp. MCPF17_011]PZF09950.1 YfbU family protein [Curtobacterium sp. MCPF17_011]
MATITLRIDDDIRDAAARQAAEDGVTLSDFVRDLVREAVVSVRDEPEPGGYVPDSLSPKDRHVLSLLHRILGRVLPENENDVDGDKEYQLERAHVLEAGLTQEYWVEFAGIANELSKRDSQRVMDILDMFRIAGYSASELQKQGAEVPAEVMSSLQYRGFDFNDDLEGKMGSYVQYLVSKGRWQEQSDFVEGHDGGNSHFPMLETYMRMLAEYRRIRERRRPQLGGSGYALTLEELTALSREWIHPDNRR